MASSSSPKRHKPNPSEASLISTLTSAISSSHTFLLLHEHLLPPSLSLSLESLLSSSLLSLRSLSLPTPPSPPSLSLSLSLPWFHRLPPNSPLWAQSFRLSHPSFLTLLSLLPHVHPSFLALSLLRLAHSAPYSSLSRRFSLPSPSLACQAFFSAVKSISHLPHLFLSPAAGATSLGVARFGPAAISVQAIVDSNGRFVDVSAGWPGSLKPEAILHQTRVYLAAEEEESGGEFVFVFGESCYPLLPWVLTAYRGGELGEKERVFNERHGEAMRVLRRAFERVRKRWGILDREWKGECLEFLPFVVVACCLLHNFVEACGEEIGEEVDVEVEVEEEFGVYEGEVSENGERVRDAVAARFLLEKR